VVENVAIETAEKLGISGSKIILEPMEGDLMLGGKSFKRGAYYDPADDSIHVNTLYWKSTDTIKRTITHEVQHYKWETVTRDYVRQKNIAEHEGALEKNGDVKESRKKDFVLYDLVHSSWRTLNSKELIKSDGFTSYSRAHWDEYKKVSAETGHNKLYFELAVNETLAEISAMQNLPTHTLPDDSPFKFLHGVYDRAYRLAKETKGTKSMEVPSQAAKGKVTMYWDDDWNPADKEVATMITVYEDGKWSMFVKPPKENSDGKQRESNTH
jgi:hypothetical protein